MRILPLFLTLLACAGDTDPEDTKEPGGPCTDGAECITEDEYCLIVDPASGAEGVCTAIPAGCTDVCDCDEASVECTNGQGCVAFGSAATIQCL